jgi:Mn2+/Fe2+ NRAMP family transporter
MTEESPIPEPPTKWREIIKWFGPGWVFAACMIGSGELILTTRTASLYQWRFLWCVPIIIFCKAVSTSSMLRYGTVTGTNFLKDLWHIKWLKWIIPYCMISSVLYLTGVGAHLGVAAGTLNLLIPNSVISINEWIFILVIIVAAITFLGVYGFLEKFMIGLTLLISFGVIAVVVLITPSIAISEMLSGLIPQIPPNTSEDVAIITWIGLLGWLGAGWGPTLGYTWWAEEKGSGMYSSKNKISVENLNRSDINRLKGWLHTVFLDLSFPYIITFIVSLCLYIAGAVILYPTGLHPTGLLLVETLSQLFTDSIGPWAYYLFLCGSFAILLSSLIGVVDGLSRSIKECLIIMWPSITDKLEEKNLLRLIVIIALLVPLSFLLLIERPIWLLLISSLLFAPAIGIIFFSSTYLCLKLPKELRPNLFVISIAIVTSIVMISTSIWQLIIIYVI